jgi:hypothetical protein
MDASNLIQLATVLDHVLSSRGDGPRVLPVVGIKVRGGSRALVDTSRPFGRILMDLLRRDTLHRMRPALGDRGEAQHVCVQSDLEEAPYSEQQRTSVMNGLSDIPLSDLQYAGDASKMTSMSSVMAQNTLYDTLNHNAMSLVCDAVPKCVDENVDGRTTAYCSRSKRAVLACMADRSNRSVMHAAPTIAATAEELAAQRGATYTAPALRFFDHHTEVPSAPTGSVDALELKYATLTFSGESTLFMTQLKGGMGARTRYKALRHAKTTLAQRSQTPSVQSSLAWMRRCLPISQAAVSVNAAAICSVWFSLVAAAEPEVLV